MYSFDVTKNSVLNSSTVPDDFAKKNILQCVAVKSDTWGSENKIGNKTKVIYADT